MSRKVCWFSSGAASAVMSRLVLLEYPDAIIVNCDLGESEDEDNDRFLGDCEAWIGKKIERIGSEEYLNIDEVFEDKKFLSSIYGAPCTREMKRIPRLKFQREGDEHYFGYTSDPLDIKRAVKFKENSPGLNVKFPLIERGLTKDACFSLLDKAGVRRPRVYDMGYPNGNCPGCVKATSPDYWSLVRKCHPDVFDRRAEQSRRFGARLARIKGERIFIDEIPEDWPTLNPTLPSCDFMCHLSGMDMEND